MKLSTKIVWGIIFLLAACGVLAYAIFPEKGIFTVALWKWFVLALLLYWFVLLVGFGRTLGNRLSCVFPLALIFIVFENDIAKVAGLKPDFANRWIILLAAGLFVVGAQLLFSKKKLVDVSQNTKSQTYNQTGSTYSGTVNKEGSTSKSFSMGSNVCYIDATTQQNAKVENKMGQLHVYYQNTDVGDTSSDLNIDIENKLGETVVHIPKDWYVNAKLENSLGEIEIRDNPDVTVRQLNVTARNQLGDVKIVDIV